MDSVRRMRDHGYKEVLLLGQNVNSYCDDSRGNIVRFPELLSSIAEIAPEMRIRFMSPHPKVGFPSLCESGFPAGDAGGDSRPSQHLSLHPPSRSKRQLLLSASHEPSVHARRIRASGRRDSLHASRLQFEHGCDIGVLRGDGGGA